MIPNNVFYNITAANSPTTPPELWNWSTFKILMQIQCDRYTTVTMKNIGKSPKFWNFETRCEKKYLESDFAHSQSCKGLINLQFSCGFNIWIENSHGSASCWRIVNFRFWSVSFIKGILHTPLQIPSENFWNSRFFNATPNHANFRSRY